MFSVFSVCVCVWEWEEEKKAQREKKMCLWRVTTYAHKYECN